MQSRPMPDEYHLRRAIDLAERGRGSAHPNPVVGCVVVDAEDEVVGEGWHERAGQPHAEIVALRQAGERARGSTVYVTLEPCGHHGRTAPCTEALIAAGVAQVVYGLEDPNPQAGGGAQRLREEGIEVTSGVLADEVAMQNEVFVHVHRHGRVHVTLKLAQSLDGRVAARDGSSRWVTSEQARVAVHALRAESDAVAVGSGTVIADDPRLTVRDAAVPRGQPRTVVFDGRGRTPVDARVVREGTIVLTTDRSETGWRREVEDGGAEVVVTDATSDGTGVELAAALRELRDRELAAVLVEGGPTLAGALMRAGLVDRLVLHVAPAIIGADGLASVQGPGAENIRQAMRWRMDDVNRVGPDLEIVARRDVAS